MKNFSTVFFQSDGVWIGKALDLPGAITQGKTLEEAKKNLKEAIEMVWDVMKEQSQQEIPKGTQIFRENLELQLS